MVGVQKCIGFDFSSCLIVTTTISFLKEMCSRRLYYYYYMPIWFVHMKTIEERKSNLNCDIEFLKWRKPFVVSFFSQTFVDLSLLFRARTTRFHRSKAFNKKKSDHPEVVLCCLVFTLMKKKINIEWFSVFCCLLYLSLFSNCLKSEEVFASAFHLHLGDDIFVASHCENSMTLWKFYSL